MNYPYNQGWPTDPFKTLTPAQMAALLKQMRQDAVNDAEDAPW